MVIDVLVEIKKIDKTFSYLVSKELEKDVKIGKRCKVPFGNKVLEGFIVGFNHDNNINYKLKEIISIIDENPVLNEELLELGDYISKKTLSTKISAYQTMLPTALKAKNNYVINKKTVLYIRKIKDYNPISEKEKILYDLVNLNDIPLKEASKISIYALNKMIEKGILEKYEKEVYRLNDDKVKISTNKTLTEEQNSVINKINLSIFKPYLLHGVTGSGKTEVYIQVIKKVIESGKKVILLVPEISLTPQIVDNFKSRFGSTVAILHSGLSNGEKYDEWRKIQRNEVNIVIGARSAIFAPLDSIGLIVIDEEHSDTYKQENTPMYNAIDIALARAKRHNCPVILGSATPSIESYTRAKNGIYDLLEMKNRVNNNMPKITLVDMKDEIKNKNRIFSKLLKEKIQDRLNKNEQIIILLNRRGYTTITTCPNCGYTHKCPKCDIPLTYHLKTSKMHCHYCNYETNKLTHCPVCNNTDIKQTGMGTEKLELEVKKEFPSARVVRMDVDTTKNKNAHKKIIEDFESLKYDILIGTQMIAKGLDFPNVTLVGVINADSSLSLPDFRSAERTFQLLNQVSGRSGRSNLPGEVIMQAFNVDHYSLEYSKKNDYLSFYNKEMSIRKILKYPPFYNLCLIKIQGINSDKCMDECDKIYSYLKENISDIILGPSACVVPKINNIYNYQIIIKYKDTKKIYKYLKYISDIYVNNNVKVSIDLNPNRI
jgi:primosomal protein N' (replication factor Y)